VDGEFISDVRRRGEGERNVFSLLSFLFSLTCVFPSALIDFFFKRCATWYTLIGQCYIILEVNGTQVESGEAYRRR